MGLDTVMFYSVSRFVEQVGRRVVSKYGDLDRLTCIYNGPSYSGQEIGFRPTAGSPHPQFPLMFVIDSNIRYLEALVAEVEVTYVGIMQTSGSGSFITIPVTDTSLTKGGNDYTAFVAVTVRAPTYQLVNSGPPPQYVLLGPASNYGTRQISVHYVGNQCSVKYHAYPRPTKLNYSQLGMSLANFKQIAEILGPLSIIAYGVDANAIQQAYSSMGPWYVPQLQIINLGFEIEQEGKWYTCTEVYGPAFTLAGVPI